MIPTRTMTSKASLGTICPTTSTTRRSPELTSSTSAGSTWTRPPRLGENDDSSDPSAASFGDDAADSDADTDDEAAVRIIDEPKFERPEIDILESSDRPDADAETDEINRSGSMSNRSTRCSRSSRDW